MQRLTHQKWSDDIDLSQELGYKHIYQRLYELENKLAEGQMVELPCRVGDTVWCTTSDQIDYILAPIECKVVHVDIDEKGVKYQIYSKDYTSNWGTPFDCNIPNHMNERTNDDFGKTVFLKREQALKKMEDNNVKCNVL